MEIIQQNETYPEIISNEQVVNNQIEINSEDMTNQINTSGFKRIGLSYQNFDLHNN